MRVSPALVQAAEAVLRGALQPAVAWQSERDKVEYAWQASPRKNSAACALNDMPSQDCFAEECTNVNLQAFILLSVTHQKLTLLLFCCLSHVRGHKACC